MGFKQELRNIHREQDRPKRASLLEDLAKNPDDALGETLKILEEPFEKGLWPICFDVLRTIGYPLNVAALPRMVAQFNDLNWPGAEEALDALRDIDPTVVAPYFVRLLLKEENYQPFHGVSDDLESIILALSHLEKPYILPCIPAVTYSITRLLNGDLKKESDPEIVLRVFTLLPLQHYPSVIPLLLQVAAGGYEEDARDAANSLLQAYSAEQLEVYKFAYTRNE